MVEIGAAYDNGGGVEHFPVKDEIMEICFCRRVEHLLDRFGSGAAENQALERRRSPSLVQRSSPRALCFPQSSNTR